MVNEPGPARDSTLVFAKGVVDVDLALYVEGHHSGQSAFGGPRVVIPFFFSYWVEDDYGTNPTQSCQHTVRNAVRGDDANSSGANFPGLFKPLPTGSPKCDQCKYRTNWIRKRS